MILALVAIAAIFWLYKINFFMTDAPRVKHHSLPIPKRILPTLYQRLTEQVNG